MNPRTAAMLAIATPDSHGHEYETLTAPGAALLAMQAALDAGATRAEAIEIAQDLTATDQEV